MSISDFLKSLKKITYIFTEITGKKDLKYPHSRNYWGKNNKFLTHKLPFKPMCSFDTSFFKLNWSHFKV